MKKNLFSAKVDGRFYYGWVMLVCAFMPMFICYVIKVNCAPAFLAPLTEELGITRTAYTQTNTIMTITMLLCSAVIGKIYKQIPVKFALTACVALTSICYVLMSFSTSIWHLYVLSAIQGLGWAGATTLPTTMPSEASAAGSVPSQKAGITGKQALTTSRWWLQFLAGLVTMIGASAFSYNCQDYFTATGLTDSTTAATIYSGALGTLILGKFLLGILSDVLHIKRTSVIAPMFYAGVFVCLALSANNMVFATIMIPLYMIGGAVPSVIPFLITSRNFGDKEYGVMSGWMNIAGNIGQIIGPTAAAFIFDITGSYRLAWVIFAILMVVVGLLYFLSNVVSKKKIEAMGYTPV